MKDKRKMLKTVSMLMAISLLTGLLSLETLAQKSDITDQNETLENHQVQKENVSERTEKSKTFLKEDGSKSVVISPERLHYYDENDKEWVNIDNTLKMEPNNNETISNKQNDLHVEFPAKLDNNTPVVVSGYDHSVSFKFQNEIQKSNAKINNDVLDIPKDPGQTDQTEQRMNLEDKYSQIDYAKVQKDTNLVYNVNPSSLKESIVLNKIPEGVLQYNYLIETDGLTLKLLDDHSIEFYEKGGKDVIFVMPAPYMFDSNQEDPQTSNNINVSLREVTQGIYELIYTPSGEWLRDSKRVLPITIDPTIEIPASQSRYSASGTFMTVASDEYGLFQYSNLPTLDDNYGITGATFSVNANAWSPYQTDYPDMELYELTSAWDNKSLINKTYTYNPKIVDRCAFRNYYGYNYVFDITRLVRKWYTGENNGMMLRPSSGGTPMRILTPDSLLPDYALYYLTIDLEPRSVIITIPASESRYVKVGNDGLIQYPRLQSFSNYCVKKATFSTQANPSIPSQKVFPDFELYRLTSEWGSIQDYTYDPEMVASCAYQNDDVYNYKFDITDLVREWRAGENNGMMLKNTDNSAMGILMPDSGAQEKDLYTLTIEYELLEQKSDFEKEIDELFDERAEKVLDEDYEEVDEIDSQLEDLEVETLTEEEALEIMDRNDTEVTPAVSKPDYKTVQWKRYVSYYTYNKTTYQVTRLYATPNEKKSKLKMLGNAIIQQRVDMKAGVLNVVKSVGATVLSAISTPYSVVISLYDIAKSAISGFSAATIVEGGGRVSYGYSLVSTAVFTYVKPKGKPDSWERLSGVSTKATVEYAYIYPIFSYKKSNGSVAVSPRTLTGAIKMNYMPANYDSVYYSVKAFTTFDTYLAWVNSIKMTCLDNKTAFTIYPVTPAFPLHVI